MEIMWAPIVEFPNYSVSNYGDIVNETTGRVLRQSTTLQGALKVKLFYDGGEITKSVKVLVAEAFVEELDPLFNTPIQLDGDQRNVRADNIMWRPRWFAWKYTRQFRRLPFFIENGPVIELESQIQYFNVYEAATLNGLLLQEVWDTITLTKAYCWPTRQRFWIA